MVGVRVINADIDGIEIDPRQNRASVIRTVLETGITDDGTDGQRTNIAAALTLLLQADIDVRTLISDLPPDEETLAISSNSAADRAAMEARFGESMFYDGAGPNRALVSREDIITVTWDSTTPEPVVSIRVAN